MDVLFCLLYKHYYYPFPNSKHINKRTLLIGWYFYTYKYCIFTCENIGLFSVAEIPVKHWCLYNKTVYLISIEIYPQRGQWWKSCSVATISEVNAEISLVKNHHLWRLIGGTMLFTSEKWSYGKPRHAWRENWQAAFFYFQDVGKVCGHSEM